MQKHSIAAAIAVALGLSACGGSDGTPTLGAFLDSAVEGVSYSASPSGKSGKTNAKGQYECFPGDTVTLKVGGIELGSTPCASITTPLSLAGLSTYTAGANAQVDNLLLFIQSLDEDDDPSNGITVGTSTASALSSKTLDFKKASTEFNTALQATLTAITTTDKFGKAYGDRAPSAERLALARAHFEEGTLGAQLGQASNTSKGVQTSAGGEVSVTKYQLAADPSLYVPYEGSNADAKKDFANGFYPAVGSGLAFKGKAADGSLEFYGITDRGPNGDSPNVTTLADGTATTNGITKMFPAPNFAPSIGLISVGKEGAVVKSLLPIKSDASTKINGLPRAIGNPVETPLTDSLKYEITKAPHGNNGLDTESLVYDAKNKVFWTSDEYGPFIAKIDATTGIILKKYGPGTGATDLPDVLKHRRANRGMEGLAMAADGKLHGFLQSPIDPLESSKSVKVADTYNLDQDPATTTTSKVNVKDYAQFARWLEFDPSTESSRLYAYPLNYAIDSQTWDRNRTGSAKLGDLMALSNGKFLVIEQGANSTGAVRNFLMLVEIPSNVTDIKADGIGLEKNSIDGSTTADTTRAWSAVVKLKKTLLLDLNAIGWTAEKAEGLTLVDEQTVALINDNDFGLRSILVDKDGKELAGDPTKCIVDANGAITNAGAVDGCTIGSVGSRVTRAADKDRPTRLWLIKFPKALSAYTLP